MEGILAIGSPEGDRTALMALYQGTEGENWAHSWDIDGDISTWYGVTVNGEGRVVTLSLSRNNLRGLIPPELGSLSALEMLNLGWNKLKGPIPPELGDASALVELILFSNKLSGPLPKELGHLRALTHLFLYNNRLSGAIPPELGNLSAMQVLNLRGNKLSGSPPKELENLYALKQLCLDGNKLTGAIPPELGNLSALQKLDLRANQLSGGVPRSLRRHPNWNNFFFDDMPADGAPVPPWKSWTTVVLPLFLGYLDLGTDVSTAISYYQERNLWWFALGLTFVVVPALVAAIFFLRDEDPLRRVVVAMHLGLLVEAFLSIGQSTYSHVLVSLRVVEPLYESVPQLMLQVHALFVEWDNDDSRWLPLRLLSILVSCASLAYATTGMVAEQLLSQRSPATDGSSGSRARCQWLTALAFGTVPENGSDVYGLHPQNFVWAFLVYQMLEIGSRFISLALLALVVRAYFFLVLVWLWVSRSIILHCSLGNGHETLHLRSQLRLVGMPFMDSVMDTLKSYYVGVALTTGEFLICLLIGNLVHTKNTADVPGNVCLVWTYVAVGCMAGKLVLAWLIVRPFKRRFHFGCGNEQLEEQTPVSRCPNVVHEEGKVDVEHGGGSLGDVGARGNLREQYPLVMLQLCLYPSLRNIP